MSKSEKHSLKMQFVAEYTAKMEELGVFERRSFVESWVPRGITFSTGYRIAKKIEDARKGGTVPFFRDEVDRKPPPPPPFVLAEVQHPVSSWPVVEPDPEPAPPEPEPPGLEAVEAVLQEIVLLEPAPRRVQVVGFGIPLMEKIQQAIDLNQSMIEYCHTQDGSGKIRNPKMLLQVVDQLAKMTLKMIDMQEKYAVQGNINMLFTIIIEEIEKESFEVTTRILDRIRRVQAEWGL